MHHNQKKVPKLTSYKTKTDWALAQRLCHLFVVIACDELRSAATHRTDLFIHLRRASLPTFERI